MPDEPSVAVMQPSKQEELKGILGTGVDTIKMGTSYVDVPLVTKEGKRSTITFRSLTFQEAGPFRKEYAKFQKNPEQYSTEMEEIMVSYITKCVSKSPDFPVTKDTFSALPTKSVQDLFRICIALNGGDDAGKPESSVQS